MRYHIKFVVFVMIAGLLLTTCKREKRTAVQQVPETTQRSASQKARRKTTLKLPPPKKDSLSYKGFKFVWGYPFEDRQFLQKLYIYKNDSLIDTIVYWYAFNVRDSNGKYYLFPPVELYDLDRDGVKEIVMHNYTGGAHCCETFNIFEIKHGELVRTTGLEGEAGLFGGVKNLDHKGLPEIIIENDAFICYDTTCVACMPTFTSYVHYRHGRLYDVTRRFPALIKAELDTFKTEFFEWKAKYYEEERKQEGLAEDLRGQVVGIYIHYSLLGRPKSGIRFIKKHLPEATDWLISHRAEIDSILDHWLDRQGDAPIDYFDAM